MREYSVKRFASYDDVDWSLIPVAPIDNYLWVTGYSPEAGAQIVMIEGSGFVARLFCREDHPMAKRTKFFDDVWCDSCLEFFAAFDPSRDEYLNIEMNSISTSHIAFGGGRDGRIKLTDIVDKPFDVRSVVRDGMWSVTAFVPFSDIEKIFALGRDVFVPGYSFRGNFYKCGDETKIEHYGAWSKVDQEIADYHVPKFFGKLTVE